MYKQWHAERNEDKGATQSGVVGAANRTTTSARSATTRTHAEQPKGGAPTSAESDDKGQEASKKLGKRGGDKQNKKSKQDKTAKESVDVEGTPKKENPDKEDSDTLAYAIKQTLKTKKAYSEAFVACENVLAQARSNPEWSWANNDSTLAPVLQAKTNLSNSTTPFINELMCNDMPSLRKRYDNDTIKPMLAKTCADLDPLIAALQEHVRLLVGMNASRPISRSSGGKPAKKPRTKK